MPNNERMTMVYYIVCSLLVFICTMSANAMEINGIKKIRQHGDITYYEIKSNRIVFAEQYQLHGVIGGVSTTATHAIFTFTGDVMMTISGEHLGVTSITNHSKSLKWQVTGMFVKLSRWENKELDYWGSTPTTFDRFVEIANEVNGDKEVVKIALRFSKFVFTETGDLALIEGNQAILQHTGEISRLMSTTNTVIDEPQVPPGFDLKRAREIVDGTVASQMVEKITICNKWPDYGPEDRLDVARVIDKDSDITSLIAALKRSYIPPEPGDPLIKPGDWWGFELRFKCKDHRDAVLSIFVSDGSYTMVGHSNPGERYHTLVHQEDSDLSSHKNPRCFFAQNLLVGKWLEAHGLPFREGTRLGIGTTNDDVKRVNQRGRQLCYAETSVPVLVNALEDKDTYIRRCAAAGLSRLGQAACSASPQLIKMLGDSHSQVRAMAVEALSFIDPSNKTACEIEKLNNDTDKLVRQKVEEALKRITGSPR